MSKRLFDIVFSVIIMVFLSPIFFIIVIIMMLTQKGGIFYVQERIGKGGKSFKILKFRSMSMDSEKDGLPRLAKINDERLTRVGKYLRKHHLDELPQLWNVFIGDMSLVGPRPERKYYIEQILKHNFRYTELYQVRPGLTSLATLYNGYTDTIDKMLRRLELDLNYLENQSMWLDIKILAKTVRRMIVGE